MGTLGNLLRDLRDIHQSLNETIVELCSFKCVEGVSHSSQYLRDDETIKSRIEMLEAESAKKFQKLLLQLGRYLSANLDSRLMTCETFEENRMLSNVHKTIRFIHESFSNTPTELRMSGNREAILPVFSNN